MSNQQKKFINICVWCAVVLFAVRCFLSWESILEDVSVYDLFGYAGEAIGIAVLLAGIYEKFLWRINPFESTPKLSKQYTDTFKSSYDQVERSASLAASIDEILGEIQLTYCYLNTPKSAYRDRSEIHYGTATLSISNPKEIDGQYYTDRKTIGDMHFVAKS